jgi:hypothetical protein
MMFLIVIFTFIDITILDQLHALLKKLRQAQITGSWRIVKYLIINLQRSLLIFSEFYPNRRNPSMDSFFLNLMQYIRLLNNTTFKRSQLIRGVKLLVFVV